MQESSVALSHNNYEHNPNFYGGVDLQTSYLGDYSIADGCENDIQVERKAIGSCSIMRVKSKKQLAFNRSWHHIRNDATDVVVLWFVKRGGLRIYHGGKVNTATAGDFAITKSLSPYFIERTLDGHAVHESLNVLVPSHIFRKFIAGDIANGFTVSTDGGLFAIVEHILTEVFTSKDKLTERTETLLLESALSALSDTVQEQKGLTQQKESVSEKRLKTALHFIDLHLSDPKLSNVRVAEACGISPRYLSFLLNKQGLSFADYVKDKRLQVASRWLSSSNPSEITIAEIAFRVGFKSPAHFSRIFKQAYDKGPREFRSECIALKHYPATKTADSTATLIS